MRRPPMWHDDGRGRGRQTYVIDVRAHRWSTTIAVYVCWGAVCRVYASQCHSAIARWRRGAPAGGPSRYCTILPVVHAGLGVWVRVHRSSWQLGAAHRSSLPFPVFVRVLSPEF